MHAFVLVSVRLCTRAWRSLVTWCGAMRSAAAQWSYSHRCFGTTIIIAGIRRRGHQQLGHSVNRGVGCCFRQVLCSETMIAIEQRVTAGDERLVLRSAAHYSTTDETDTVLASTIQKSKCLVIRTITNVLVGCSGSVALTDGRGSRLLQLCECGGAWQRPPKAAQHRQPKLPTQRTTSLKHNG